MARSDKDAAMLTALERLLASGLETQTEPVPESSQAVESILAELRELDPDDVRGKLVLGGFTPHPHPMGVSCQDCMYFLFHRQWCDLPELSLPVEGDWWCRLWRV